MEAVKARSRDNSSMTRNRSSWAVAEATLEFGRFRVLLRQRRLVADGVPIELGTRAFDLLLVLLQADGSLVTKDELLSRVWPDVLVAEENLKVQISALRKALGEDRDFIRTEFGRGYRFTAAVRSTMAWTACGHTTRRQGGGSRLPRIADALQRHVNPPRRSTPRFRLTLRWRERDSNPRSPVAKG
jgi:DNA-binding winged helix-turn-helix (wHTH) protein